MFGIERRGGMVGFLGVISIGMLFGLGMDYEVLVMWGIDEEYSKRGDNDYCMKVGLKERGGVIVGGGLMMFSVFFGFV
ncbi:hypothetical protein, partial [Staphylococcus aureus]|uniref:hypothetical protein n=1 Tax=Staphylococcus aureus TaxID=1280 RepID=UPI00164246A0